MNWAPSRCQEENWKFVPVHQPEKLGLCANEIQGVLPAEAAN